MKEELIAPCGMNCRLCVAYQFREYDYNKKGFKRKYCPGCQPRGQNCLHMQDACHLLGEGLVRFCFECDRFPCKRLKSLNKRYQTKYQMSMLENLLMIKEKGMTYFLEKEKEKWSCSDCGSIRCCHNGLCLQCDSEKLVRKKH
jgi:hypothetical protein